MTTIDDVVRRPQRADARRNFDALIAAGRDVFAAEGAGASLEEIARRAGVGIGTLYRNFPTREALLEAVYVEEVQGLSRAADEVSSLEPWDALETWLHRFLEYLRTKQALVEGLNKTSEVMVVCRAAMYSAGGPLLARAQAAGVARDDVMIEDAVRMLAGVSSAAFADDDQRDRVMAITIDALRAR
ncbi:AcrR family transcriptional regulator [Microbacteriaceae bacterium SG_E_30_P1]|uniref:AcrR family transcriptional regulator n=1 Tax=Antiquaquibacter oligotrophicus TaxID=2880260 RepID=A0ABT6KLT7_9MICO|nr:TetR/AcrR family transcriptional regulator [Antiquaquibacter oligotrophicus]MDH6180072.1 AcrR family transcriptional regulator [Antiquaquibacter oligotrophicus]UDF14177.1 TetR/AcrR family transcriptional regulator [Antiquaquibacter oligotrophicus]